ncbi:MAG: hypothetical protein MJK13_08040 [Pseudomonadales bacterium]|nr:hypothetical protein [Pseudomonadales bacterium]
MYFPKPGIKKDPVRRWKQSDRVFFGHGACHILAGVYLKKYPNSGFYAVRVIPVDGYVGNHIFVTDGIHAFDYHGYSQLNRLIEHHKKGWLDRFSGWNAKRERVDFSLLDTTSLNARKMLGPDQYLHNPIERALQFLTRFEHDSRHTRGIG